MENNSQVTEAATVVRKHIPFNGISLCRSPCISLSGALSAQLEPK